MKLKDWRIQQNLSLADFGRMLGIGGVNPGRTAQRIETGEQAFDADMAERVRKVTADAVRVEDLHQTRLQWLASNKPDRLCALPAPQVQP